MGAKRGSKNALGTHHTEEFKKEKREIMKGNSFAKGKHWNLSKKTRQKMSGENHHNWKGGITPKNHEIRTGLEIKLWRKAVFERDSFTCVKCGQYGGKLIGHHILNFADFSELRTSIENGITFCENCHKNFHHIYGVKNNTKEQLSEFLNKD